MENLDLVSAWIVAHIGVIAMVFSVLSEVLMRMVPTAKPMSWVLYAQNLLHIGASVLKSVAALFGALDQMLSALVPQKIKTNG